MMKLDVRGEICPYPMMKAVEALRQLPEGETLEVLTDHAPALTTIPWAAAKQGYAAEIEAAGLSEWRIVLTRAAKETRPEEVLAKLQKRLAELKVSE